MKFTVYQESRLGKRKLNQDRVAWRHTRETVLLVVADGMGGHAHGEVAAQVAVEQICAAFEQSAAPRLDHPFIFLSRVLPRAHQAIVAAAQRDGLAEAPRTTCVVCVVQDGAAYWAHAGDSRLYLLRGGRVVGQTRDHSRVQFLMDQGVISDADARNHPERNRVLSSLGGESSPQVTCSRKTPLKSGDVLVLCTDGAWGPVDTPLLAESLSQPDVMRSVPAFLDQAEAAAGVHGDNATLIAMCWESEGASVDTEIAEIDELERRQVVDAEISDAELENAINEVRKIHPFEEAK